MNSGKPGIGTRRADGTPATSELWPHACDAWARGFAPVGSSAAPSIVPETAETRDVEKVTTSKAPGRHVIHIDPLDRFGFGFELRLGSALALIRHAQARRWHVCTEQSPQRWRATDEVMKLGIGQDTGDPVQTCAFCASQSPSRWAARVCASVS
jgi:hypothetical protein